MTFEYSQLRKTLRTVIAAAIITAFSGLWLYRWFYGHEPDTLWTLIMVIIVFASGMTVFGREVFTASIEEAQEATGMGGEEEDEEEDDE